MSASLKTLNQLLVNRGADREVTLIRGGDDRQVVGFDALWRDAADCGAKLLASGCKPGEYLVLCMRSNAAFLSLFWGALRAGMIPVPLAVGTTKEHQAKLTAVTADLGTAHVCADVELAHAKISVIAWEQLQSVAPSSLVDATPKPDDIAFIQYSSGSTGQPKGVVLTHANLLTNIRAICDAMGWGRKDVGLSWMPLTHDMGLIVMHLCFVYMEMNHAIMDTDVFVRRPTLWLEEATRLKATALCSPNFGYKHFLKVFERRGSDSIDLGAVKSIFNGAEPISHQQCQTFMSAMQPHGLAADAMLPVYGLAEATVGVSIPPHDNRYQTVILNRHHLNTGDYCDPISAESPDAITFVKVGHPINDVSVRVVDDKDRELANGHIGHLQLKGPSVTRGYLNDPDPAATFTSDGWLRTGDCGAFIERQLIITGRAKDIIIVNGQNYYAHDLESLTYHLEGVELGKVVVAGAMRPADSVEQLVVFILHRGDSASFAELARVCAGAVAEGAQIECDYFVPVSRIPKTTSGKVQRALLARNFANGEYDATAIRVTGETIDSTDADASKSLTTLERLRQIANQHSGGVALDLDDDLFDAGISSLTLTEIVLAFEEVFPGKVSIDELFDYPTLRKLAAHIDAE